MSRQYFHDAKTGTLPCGCSLGNCSHDGTWISDAFKAIKERAEAYDSRFIGKALEDINVLIAEVERLQEQLKYAQRESIRQRTALNDEIGEQAALVERFRDQQKRAVEALQGELETPYEQDVRPALKILEESWD